MGLPFDLMAALSSALRSGSVGLLRVFLARVSPSFEFSTLSDSDKSILKASAVKSMNMKALELLVTLWRADFSVGEVVSAFLEGFQGSAAHVSFWKSLASTYFIHNKSYLEEELRVKMDAVAKDTKARWPISAKALEFMMKVCCLALASYPFCSH